MNFSKSKLDLINSLLKDLATESKRKQIQKFFKMQEGSYAERDQFMGVYTPDLKKVAIQYKDLNFFELSALISSEFNEKRLLALMILVRKFKNSDEEIREKIYDFYLEHISFINNWNLVDASAPYLLGPYLFHRDKKLLFELIKSESIWERRIGVVSTFYFIKENQFDVSLEIAEKLLGDSHDLIHKAVGWMLRTIGKKDIFILKKFLDQHSHKMPRVMLRYAIEKFSATEREKYLKKPISAEWLK